MSPRTVRFTYDEIVWECRQRTTCQRCAVTPQPALGLSSGKGFHKPLFTDMLNVPLQGLDRDMFDRLWYYIVIQYTPRSLSIDDDRLSALAGIIELLNRRTKYTSSFGLWLPFFLDQLLWMTWLGGVSNRCNGIDNVGAPTWSWVGVRSKIRYDTTKLKGQSVIYTADLTQLPPATSFGQISSLCAQISLPVSAKIHSWVTTCQAVPICRHYEDDPYPSEWALSHSSRFLSTGQVEFEQLAWRLFLGNTPYTKEQARFVQSSRLGNRYYLPDVKPDQQQRLVCLLIKQTWKDWGNDPEKPEIDEHCLVLERVCSSKHLYKRKGVCTNYFSRHDYRTELRDKLDRALGSNDEQYIRQTQEEYDTCTAILGSKDEA